MTDAAVADELGEILALQLKVTEPVEVLVAVCVPVDDDVTVPLVDTDGDEEKVAEDVPVIVWVPVGVIDAVIVVVGELMRLGEVVDETDNVAVTVTVAVSLADTDTLAVTDTDGDVSTDGGELSWVLTPPFPSSP